jgi:hypothetical protein
MKTSSWRRCLASSVAVFLVGAAATTAAQSPASSASERRVETSLIGTWEAVRRSGGAMGSVWTFLPDGKLEMRAGPMVESWYVVKGDQLIEPPESKAPGAAPQISRFRIEGDTLIKQQGNGELRFTRIGKAPVAATPIVGTWRIGNPGNDARLEYTPDGLAKVRIVLRTMHGTYDAMNKTFALTPENSNASRGGQFRLEGGLLVLTQPDGKTEATYIRAGATKEELKRAGVGYGNEPAQIDPPAGL